MVKTFPQLGFHYYPDDRHYTDQDLSTWLPVLASLGAHWLTIRGSARRAVPEGFIKGCIESGIEPIIHIPHPVGKIDEPSLRPILESYSRWGARFVIIYDRPNLKDRWANAAWSTKGLVERFVDLALPTLHLVRSSGLAPVLPPLEPGGDYWDTAFLEGVLKSIKRRRHQSLLRDLNLSFYAWTYDRPIDWGIGGPKEWEGARPYRSTEDSQDHIGFRIFDWYDSIGLNVTGELMPLICVGSGVNRRYTSATADQHAEQSLSMLKLMESSDLPTTVRNLNFYLLACESNHKDYDNAWFPSVGSPISSVTALHKYFSKNKQAVRKPLRHYILLPEGMDIQEVVSHTEVARILRKHSPVVGSSPFEARLAQTVTLVGGNGELSPSIENDLNHAGCNVKRISLEEQAEILEEDVIADKQDQIQAIINRLVNENGRREK